MPLYNQSPFISGDTRTFDLWGSIRSKGSPWYDVMGGGLLYKCSASTQTTTGSITGGTNTLTLAGAIDFVNNQWISVVLDDGTVMLNLIVSGAGTTTLTLVSNAASTATAKIVSHDDAPAINDAILKANTDGGGTVFVPPGTYMCGRVRVRSNVTLIIATGATLKSVPGNANSGVVEYFNSSVINSRITGGGTIDGYKSASPAPTCATAYLLTATSDPQQNRIDNLTFQNAKGNGLSLFGAYCASVSNIDILSPDGHGLWLSGSLVNRLSNVLINSAGLNGVHETGTSAAQVWSNLTVQYSGRIDSTSYGDNFYADTGCHGDTIAPFWSREGGRKNLNLNTSSTGGLYNILINTHQNSAGTDHVCITDSYNNTISGSVTTGGTASATSVVNIIAGTGNTINVTYTPDALISGSKPVVGAARLDVSNRITVRQGNSSMWIGPGVREVQYRRIVIPSGGRWWIDANDDVYSGSNLKIVAT